MHADSLCLSQPDTINIMKKRKRKNMTPDVKPFLLES